MLYQFAAARAARRPMPLSIRLPGKPPSTLYGMNELCTKHSILDAYLWLSHKFPSTFVQVKFLPPFVPPFLPPSLSSSLSRPFYR